MPRSVHTVCGARRRGSTSPRSPKAPPSSSPPLAGQPFPATYETLPSSSCMSIGHGGVWGRATVLWASSLGSWSWGREGSLVGRGRLQDPSSLVLDLGQASSHRPFTRVGSSRSPPESLATGDAVIADLPLILVSRRERGSVTERRRRGTLASGSRFGSVGRRHTEHGSAREEEPCSVTTTHARL